ncbi:MAG: protein-export chaperone SecB [Alphaproteobacteria bacterium]|nr:protein-export chaperone SecB [Alphaproteobacteria bacterium]TAD90465.1 MAG: protein-export chaperone SecB [Alphaproteobacteria bacterium]
MTDAANGTTQQPLPPPLVVQMQYLKDFSFENPNAPRVYMEQRDAPQVQVDVRVNATPLADRMYEVVLHIEAEASAGATKLFVVDLAYAGIFQVAQDIPEQHLQPIVLIECPRLLFPYARALISDASRDGGFPPLLIQPFDFTALYQQRLAEAQAQATAQDRPLV